MKAKKIFLYGEVRIMLIFEFNTGIIQILKERLSARWSSTYKAWHVEYSAESVRVLQKEFPYIEFEVPSQKSFLHKNTSLNKKQTVYIQEYLQLFIK